MQTEWRSFQGGAWEKEVNVKDFIQKNYHPYDGDDSFLEGPTQDTTDLWEQVLELSRQEREAGGVLDMDTKIISTITSHGPGYLNKEKDVFENWRYCYEQGCLMGSIVHMKIILNILEKYFY